MKINFLLQFFHLFLHFVLLFASTCFVIYVMIIDGIRIEFAAVECAFSSVSLVDDMTMLICLYLESVMLKLWQSASY